MSINDLFFELIRVAIGTQETLSRPPSKAEWAELYAMAKKQSLIGICFAGLQKLYKKDILEPITPNLDEVQYLTWMGMAAKIQQRNEVVNAQCVEVQHMMEKVGFQTYIMKGQGNAALYNDNLKLLRQSGDIDIYLEGGFEKVNAFVQRTCPTNEINELEIQYHCLQDTEVEIHYRPFIMRNPFKNGKLQRFFKKEGENCFDNKIALPNGAGKIAVPTATFNLVHQLVHIYHHLLIGGVGMRQLMDYYFVVKLEMDVENGLSVKKVKECISELGLDKFASALMWTLSYLFGLEREAMLWNPEEKGGLLLLHEVMMGGNFGRFDERIAHNRTKWQSFWMLSVHNLRLWKFCIDDLFWGPLWRLYHFAWRKIKGYK